MMTEKTEKALKCINEAADFSRNFAELLDPKQILAFQSVMRGIDGGPSTQERRFGLAMQIILLLDPKATKDSASLELGNLPGVQARLTNMVLNSCLGR
jgi:hypothetical protein